VRRRRVTALGASLAFHAGVLVAALLLLSRERALGALFIDLTHWAGPDVAGAGGAGDAAAPVAHAAAAPRGAPPVPPPRAERRADAPGVVPAAPVSPPLGEAAPPAALTAVSEAPPARPAAPNAPGDGEAATAGDAPGRSGAATGGGGAVPGGGSPGVGVRGGGGVGTAPAVSRGLALAVPGAGDGAGGAGTEYGPYLARLRERLQGSLRYPSTARRRGLEGTVALEIVIRPDGTLGGVAVADSSAHALLDDAALEAVRGLAPEPFPPGVAPRVLRVRLPVVFTLR
jgi:protein TonB